MGEIQKESMILMPVVILSILITKNLLFPRRPRLITVGMVGMVGMVGTVGKVGTVGTVGTVANLNRRSKQREGRIRSIIIIT